MRDAVVETVQMVRRGEKTHEGERSALVYVGIAYEIQESRGVLVSRAIVAPLNGRRWKLLVWIYCRVLLADWWIMNNIFPYFIDNSLELNY